LKPSSSSVDIEVVLSKGVPMDVLGSLGRLGVDQRDFLYCETYLVHDSSVTSFADGDSAQAATGGVGESSW